MKRKLLILTLCLSLLIPVRVQKVEAAATGTLIAVTSTEVVKAVVATVLIASGMEAAKVLSKDSYFINDVINELSEKTKNSLDYIAAAFALTLASSKSLEEQLDQSISIPKELTTAIVSTAYHSFMNDSSNYEIMRKYPMAPMLVSDLVNVNTTKTYGGIIEQEYIVANNTLLLENKIDTGLTNYKADYLYSIGGISFGYYCAKIVAHNPYEYGDYRFPKMVVDTSLVWMPMTEAIKHFQSDVTITSHYDNSLLHSNDLVLAVKIVGDAFLISYPNASDYSNLIEKPYDDSYMHEEVYHPIVLDQSDALKTVELMDYVGTNDYYINTYPLDSAIDTTYWPQGGGLSLQDEYTDETGALIIPTSIIAGLEIVNTSDLAISIPYDYVTDYDDEIAGVIALPFPSLPTMGDWDFGWDISAAIKALSDWIAALFGWLAAAFKWLVSYLVAALGIDKLYTALVKILNTIITLDFSQVIEAVLDIFSIVKNLFTLLGDFFKFVLNLIDLGLSSISTMIDFLFTKVIYGFYRSITDFINNIVILFMVLPYPLDMICDGALRITGAFIVMRLIQAIVELFRK